MENLVLILYEFLFFSGIIFFVPKKINENKIIDFNYFTLFYYNKKSYIINS